jgi:hypothetical protein
MPSSDHTVELQNLLLDPAQLNPECRETGTGYLGNSLVSRIGNDFEQLLDAEAPDWRNDPELGKMSADGIDDGCLLTDEKMARAMEHQAALLLRCLGWHKPHIGSGDCLADRLGIGGVVLVPLHVRLNVGWRHQLHGVAQCLELARPVMRRGATLDADQAG